MPKNSSFASFLIALLTPFINKLDFSIESIIFVCFSKNSNLYYINDNDGICYEACFYLCAVVVCF